MKGEDAVEHSRVTRGFMKFCLGFKNLNNQAMSGKSKTMDSEAMFKAIEGDPVNSAQRVLGKLNISQPSVLSPSQPWQKYLEL